MLKRLGIQKTEINNFKELFLSKDNLFLSWNSMNQNRQCLLF